LAAPAFVAALLGDRVRSVFLVAGKLLAVVDLTVPSDDAFLGGQPVRALAVDYDLLPIALCGADRTPRPQPLNVRLSAGDRLTIIIGLNDLQRLLRREIPPRTWAIDVTDCPLPARGWMIQLARTHRHLSTDMADDKIAQMPCRIAEHLTRGQAEDLLFLLLRERVAGRLTNAG